MVNKKKVTAIIPAYNEEKRISVVIKTLKKSKLIDEIIVIDDGSSDETFKVIKKIKGIRCLKFKKNKGKGKAIDFAISKAKANIIFLCDSDLIKFKGDMADKIILPVLLNKTNLNIGLRNNQGYKIIRKLNLKSPMLFISGERAFKKEIWKRLPGFYKKGYRLETGMNYFAKKNFNGFSFIFLNHNQVRKELKSGIIKGTIMRWKMNLNLIEVFFRFNLYDNLFKN